LALLVLVIVIANLPQKPLTPEEQERKLKEDAAQHTRIVTQSEPSPELEEKRTPADTLRRNLQTVTLSSWELKSATLQAEVMWRILGLFPQTELEGEMSQVMTAANAVRRAHPEVKVIKIAVRAPLVPKKDQYGNIIKDQPATGLVVALSIPMIELARFPLDYDWSLYSVYAAHRFIDSGGGGLNKQMEKDWYAELQNETKMGGLTPLPQ
jgi:hypothetical protein